MIASILRRPFVLLLFAAVALMVIGIAGPEALAEGGQKRTQNPVFNEDGEVVGVVVPVDCKEYTDHSGQTVYFCQVEEED